MKLLIRFTDKIKEPFQVLKSISYKLDALQKAIGRVELNQKLVENSDELHRNEFTVYSQWGEDGIIQFLIRNVAIEKKIFVEFGVQDYRESTTRFLLQHNNWSGLVMDSSPENIQHIKADPIYWRYNLKVDCAFIDKDNINNILKRNGVSEEIGLLSVDIDGNDYWVWEAIDCISPRIVVCEYNSLFGFRNKVTIPYEKFFAREKAHFSVLYYGASITALDHLAKLKGYSLVGSNSAGNNLFFVRKDLAVNLKTYSPECAYVKAQFRESRDAQGNLTFLDFAQRLNQISELPLYDLDQKCIIKVKDLDLL